MAAAVAIGLAKMRSHSEKTRFERNTYVSHARRFVRWLAGEIEFVEASTVSS